MIDSEMKLILASDWFLKLILAMIGSVLRLKIKPRNSKVLLPFTIIGIVLGTSVFCSELRIDPEIRSLI